MRITGKSAVAQKQSSLVDQSSKSDCEGQSGAGRKTASKCANTLEFQVLEAKHGYRQQLPQFREDIENKRRLQFFYFDLNVTLSCVTALHCLSYDVKPLDFTSLDRDVG